MDQNNSKEKRVIKCKRCDIDLKFQATKKFHEGTNWGLLGELGELFVNEEEYDVYLCPSCGSIEFFLDKVGEDKRPQ